MPVGSHKDAFLAHQKVKKTFNDQANNDLPKSAAQILLDFVKNQRQIVSENVPESIEISDIEKYDRQKVEEALHSVENLCGKCNESHDNNCFVNQARRVLIAMLTGVDVKEKFDGAQSLEELLKIAEDMKTQKEAEEKNRQSAASDGASAGGEKAGAPAGAGYENIDKDFEKLGEGLAKLKKDYFELKEKDIFRATLIDEVVDTIKSVAGGDFKSPMPVHEDDQLGKIAAAFNTMLDTINRMFINLDSEVAKRSSELKTLMGNIKIGVFTMNRDLRINREYSKECLKIFECEEIGGMNFLDLIQVYDRQAEKKEEIKRFIGLYFAGLALDDDSMNTLNPLVEHKLKEKYLQFSFYPIKTGEGAVENMLVQCLDLTANKLLQMEIDAKDAEGRQIRKMVLNREAFNDFISETVKMVRDASKIAGNNIDSEALAELYRIAHTIKGGAGCFDLGELINHTSGFEDALGRAIKSGAAGEEERASIAAGVKTMSALVDKTIAYSEKIFGKSSAAGDEFEFSFKKSHLDELIKKIKDAAAAGANIGSAAESFYELPAGRVFAKSIAMVAPLAQRLSKEIRLEVTGSETLIPFSMCSKLSEVMLHLVRNAIDHAIEPPEEREEAGKPFEGTIKINVKRNGGLIEITAADDGRGLDPVKISESALKKGIVSETELAAMDDAQKTALIFRPGFSTKSDVTNVSGRGVGMDIVKNAIEKDLKASLKVDSVPGRGTSFTIKAAL